MEARWTRSEWMLEDGPGFVAAECAVAKEKADIFQSDCKR